MMLQDHISQWVRNAVDEAQRQSLLPPAAVDDITIEQPQNPENGDFACTLPLKLAGPMKMNPMTIAERLVSLIPVDGPLEKVWAVRPGFVNFSLRHSWLAERVDVIREAGAAYGDVRIGAGKRVQVEFVSVNPTGPLHVGHVRGAVFGSALANILEAAGYEVVREYYFNDAGSQMDRFNESLYARYQQHYGMDAEVPTDGYQGRYLIDMATELSAKEGDRFVPLPREKAIRELGELGVGRILDSIREDLKKLRVSYDVWFSERSLYSEGQYEAAIRLLRDSGYLTDREGATWFTSKALGDDMDKVVVRSTGDPTYFATDVAYHYNKFLERHFDRVIDVLGADHQGHVPFLKAVVNAMGVAPERLDLVVHQMVTLKRGGEVVRVSKRTGELITVRELVEEVGADACRYFFLSRSPESQMEFDLEMAQEQSSENPVYYIQYAHARISSILRVAQERAIEHQDGDVSLLTHEAELALIRKMMKLPELIEMMARSLEPHHLPHYAVELATAFHWFYERCRVVSSIPEDIDITRARLKLVEAARIVLARCLSLMIMEAPEEM